MQNFVEQALRTESLTFNPVEPRILHAVIGLNTEAVELLSARDSVNFIEELGDSFWYCALLSDAAGFNYSYPPFASSVSKDQMPAYRKQLIETVSEMLDLCKKATFYGRELDIEALENLYIDAMDLLATLSNTQGKTQEEVETIVINKLKARFPNKFTEEAAYDRDLDKEREVLENGS